MVNVDEPPFLAVGTEVSAKYKGAFCEARIKKLSKSVKCKVLFSNRVSAFFFDDAIRGELKIGATVEVRCGDKKEFNQVTIQKIQDCSQYTVVFDDGDITSLKRNALCLKSGRHFSATATLDQLPLTHPEHIGVPVRNSIVHSRRSRKHKKSVGKIDDEEVTSMEEKDIGKVVCVVSNDKKKVKDNWFPGLVVASTAQSSVKTNITEDYLVRSFKDGKYYAVSKQEITEFTKEIGARVENPTLKTAVEKATLYLDKDELPPHWDRDLLFGLEKHSLTTDSEGVYDSDHSDETFEEKDHFVAQLFKFMDDRGTPLNQVPIINGKDVDLYKLFKMVNNLGGFNKVSKFKQWKIVATKIGHEPSIFIIKQVYQQYLHSFEDFYRKLGCTMLNHPRGVRSRNRFSRSIIRDVDKALPSTSTAEKNKNQKQESAKDNESIKDVVINKKTAKNSKLDEKDLKKSDKENKTKKETNKKEEERKNNIEFGLDDDEIVEDKKGQKKKYTKNLFGKSKAPKKQKIPKVKPTETGLPVARKMRAIKEQIKTFVKVLTPFKKSKRGAAISTKLESANKTNLDEDVPKLTRSRSVPDRSRKMSVLSDQADGNSTLIPKNLGKVVENQAKIKAENQAKTKGENQSKTKVENQGKARKTYGESDKKKYSKKMKVDKNAKPELNIPHVNYKMEPLGLSALVVPGDILSVFYGDKHNIYSTTYDAKVISTCSLEGSHRYFVHYVGWNSRYDEWVDRLRISCKRGPHCHAPEGKLDNDIEIKKLQPTTIRRSITPNKSKKSPGSNGRPTRTCTLGDQPSSIIENSDSENEYSGNLVMTKQCNKRNQQSKTIKSEPNVVIKTKVIGTDNHKKSLYPKTYPSKEVLMQRNTRKRSKSCVFKVHNKSEEIELCEQVTLKTPNDLNAEMPPPITTNNTTNNTKSNINKEILEVQNEDKAAHDVTIESKIPPINYLSPNKELENNAYQPTVFESPGSVDEGNEMNIESTTLLTKSKIASVIFYRSSSEDEESVQLKKQCEDVTLPLNDLPDESKISGTDFDLNKIRSEMKGLMPSASANSHIDLNHSEKSMVQSQVEIDVEKNMEPVTDDVYEFKEFEPYDLKTVSVIEEKHRRIIKYNDQPKSYNFETPIEPPVITESLIQVEATEQNELVIPIVSNNINTSQFDTSVENNVIENSYKDHLNLKDGVESSIFQHQPGIESDGSENMVISDVIIDSKHINETDKDFQHKPCHIDESDMKDEVLNLCMKPPESPPNKIFSMPELNDTDNVIIEDDDDEDDDELKLVIADDKTDTDYQMHIDLVVDKEHNSSSEQTEEVQVHSLPPMPPSIHQLPTTVSEDFKSSFDLKRNTILHRDTDDESTTSCNESIQNALMQSFQMYSNNNNQSSKTKIYQPYLDNNDESTKSGFEFESNSKSPTFENTENVEPIVQFSIGESTNKEYNYENIISEKEGSTFLPELQCREEIVDEETLNNALVIEYNRNSADYDIHKPSTSKGYNRNSADYDIHKPSTSKGYNRNSADYDIHKPSTSKGYNRNSADYDIHKPSTSKGYFDSIHQPGSSKDCLYKTDISNDVKNNDFIDVRQANLIKSVIFDAPSTSRSVIIDDKTQTIETCKDSVYNNVPSTSQSSIYDNPIPSTSKVNYNSESNVNDVLFCEETIPGSPTGTSEEQFYSEDTKRTAMEQDLYEEREAASAMYAMNQSFRRPMITLMGATEAEMEEYTRILQTDGMLDQTHLQFLAEISSRNLGIKINEPTVSEPSVTEPSETEPSVTEPTIPEPPEPEPIIKPKLPEKSQSKKRKNSREHSTSKRHKSSAITASTIQISIEKPPEIKIPIPMRNGKPLVEFSPDMDSTQRQAHILARINDLRKEFIVVKTRISVVDRRRKKIRKRKREMAKIAKLQNKQMSAVK